MIYQSYYLHWALNTQRNNSSDGFILQVEVASGKFWQYLQVSLANGVGVGLCDTKCSLARTVISMDGLHGLLLFVVLPEDPLVPVCLKTLVLHLFVPVNKSFSAYNSNH